MGNKDYADIGLKCGIEIHQQLDTHKLFCRCPSSVREDEPDIVVKRKMRAVAGETGEIDNAAAFEMSKGKDYLYEGYNDTTCLVELDEEPPQKLNKEALNTALQISLMLNAKPVDEIQVMRKTVVDGSNTSGFQRTALIARNGLITTEEGRVRIPVVCLEEDSARKIRTEKDSVSYNIDRLGIPLIEITTMPDITTPQQVKTVAAYIGMILRSTNKVKRGIGTIRQDVNVSIKAGARIEIKGAQDLKTLPKLVEYEIMRQVSLLDIKKELDKDARLPTKKIDITDIMKDCKSSIIREKLASDGKVIAVRLPGFAGFVGREVQPGKRLGTEFSDRAKAAAGVGGLFHSDELPKYGIEQADVKKIREKLGCKEDDAFIFIADEKNKAERALNAAIERAKEVFIGIPQEVRKANTDATTCFLRPMPGAERMYPETDINPIITDTEDIKTPELLVDRSKRYVEEFSISEDLATKIVKSGIEMKRFTDQFQNIKPGFIAETIISAPKMVKKKYDVVVKPTPEQFEEVFLYLNENKISKESIIDILREIEHEPIVDIVKRFRTVSDDDLVEKIKEIVNENKGANFGAIMGIVMQEYRGKVSGKKVSEILKRFVK